MPSRLIFFGTEQFSIPTLQALLDAGHTIVAIVTKPDTTRGRGRKMFIHPIKQMGLDHGIPVLQPEKMGAITDELIDLNADVAVLVSYGKIIPKRILNVFKPIGIVNVHPSHLPKYRGPSPIESAILSGDTSTAISIMRLDEGMDTGPIFAQQDIPLTGNETKPELSERLAAVGARLLVDTLPDILSGTLQPKPQKNTDVSVTSLISKQDGVLDPTTDTATVLERKVRAYQDYPKPHLQINNTDVIVTSSAIVAGPSTDALTIPCADKTYLEVTSLIAPSGRTMTGVEFIRGYLQETQT